MIIGNFQEFYKLIKNEPLLITKKLEACINSAARICNCQRNIKLKKLDECNAIYVEYIKSNAATISMIFKNKIQDSSITFNSGNTIHIATVKLN